jgi:hypothetical protein
MSRASIVAVLGVLTLALPVCASAGSGDVSSTRAYVLANYALVRAAHTELHIAEASISALNVSLGAQCPKIALEAPQNGQSQQLSKEVAGALWSIVYHTDVGAVDAFVNAVAPLHWSKHKLTGIARRYATSLRQLTQLPTPEICADLRAWIASGFKTVPASTIAFDKRLEAIGANTIPQRLLAPYERSSSVRAIALRADKLESQLDDDESSIGFNDWNMLLETLGLSQ